MYKPEDIHGWSTYWTYNANEILKNKENEIKKMKQQIKDLENQIEELEKEKNFLLDGIVRQYIQDGAKK